MLLAIVGSLLIMSSGNAGMPGPKTAHERVGNPPQYVITKDDFFDFEFAKRAFSEMQNFSDLDNGYDAEFFAWERKYRNRPLSEALEALANHPNRDKVKEAHDLQWVYTHWKDQLVDYHRPTSLNIYYVRDKWKGWNDWSEKKCAQIVEKNIFSRDCLIPDWRTQNQKIKDLNTIIRVRGLQKNDISALEDLINDPSLDNKSRDSLSLMLKQIKSQ